MTRGKASTLERNTDVLIEPLGNTGRLAYPAEGVVSTVGAVKMWGL